MKYNYIIAFSDLSDKKQNEIIMHLKEALRSDTAFVESLSEVVGADRFDIDRADVDRMMEETDEIVSNACQKSWYEWSIEV